MMVSGDDTSSNENEFQNDRILSVAQELVYGCSAGKKWTTKHIGLSSTLHQITRSRRVYFIKQITQSATRMCYVSTYHLLKKLLDL